MIFANQITKFYLCYNLRFIIVGVEYTRLLAEDSLTSEALRHRVMYV